MVSSTYEDVNVVKSFRVVKVSSNQKSSSRYCPKEGHTKWEDSLGRIHEARSKRRHTQLHGFYGLLSLMAQMDLK